MDVNPAMAVRGERIRALREARGWRQYDLAYRCHLAVSFVSDIERGKRNPSAVVLGKIAEALDTNTDYLLGRTDDPRTIGNPAGQSHEDPADSTRTLAAHAKPPPPGVDPDEWERRARQRLEELIEEVRRDWEETQRKGR